MNVELATQELELAVAKGELRLTLASAVNAVLNHLEASVSEHEYNTLVNNLDELSQQYQEMRSECARRAVEIESLRATIEDRDTTIRSLRSECDAETDRAGDLQEELGAAKKHAQDAHDAYQQIKNELAHRKQQLGAIALLVRV